MQLLVYPVEVLEIDPHVFEFGGRIRRKGGFKGVGIDESEVVLAAGGLLERYGVPGEPSLPRRERPGSKGFITPTSSFFVREQYADRAQATVVLPTPVAVPVIKKAFVILSLPQEREIGR